MINLHLLAFSAPNAGGEGGGGAGGLLGMLPMFVMLGLVFWFMIIRPQKKQQDQRNKMLEAVKRGDRIITSGGLFATVKDVKADRVVATIGEGIKVEIAKTAISAVLEEGQ